MTASPVVSYALVLAQFALIGAIAYFGSLGASWERALFLGLGAALGLWAVAAMRLHLSIFPDVRANQVLCTNGPYRFVRHPMYTAVLLATMAWVLPRPSALPAALWAALALVLWAKIRYEEQLLQAHFPSYAAYMKTTKRLLPFVV
jgi:protein-S-isoprenylcysteine O-methyltransferase Ste14